ncbi:MAG: CBS domain-containing protein [Pirellulaceae bacterium]
MTAIEEISQQLKGAVKDVMTVQVHTATTGTHVSVVADMMARYQLRRVVVVDEHKKVIGVVSQRDIVRALLTTIGESGQENRASLHVEQILSVERPITVGPDVPLAKAAYVLATNKIGCLPVVNQDHLLMGVLSTSDLIRHLAGDQIEGMESAFRMYSPTVDSNTRIPAYIRKVNGDLVIPMKNIENRRAKLDFAVLGYDPPTGRILIKFLRTGADDAIQTKIVDDNLVIPARGFVRHFNLVGKSSAFDVADHNQSKFLVLTPKQPTQNNVEAIGTT